MVECPCADGTDTVENISVVSFFFQVAVHFKIDTSSPGANTPLIMLLNWRRPTPHTGASPTLERLVEDACLLACFPLGPSSF